MYMFQIAVISIDDEFFYQYICPNIFIWTHNQILLIWMYDQIVSIWIYEPMLLHDLIVPVCV